jgi:hypothetical protein
MFGYFVVTEGRQGGKACQSLDVKLRVTCLHGDVFMNGRNIATVDRNGQF